MTRRSNVGDVDRERQIIEQAGILDKARCAGATLLRM